MKVESIRIFAHELGVTEDVYRIVQLEESVRFCFTEKGKVKRREEVTSERAELLLKVSKRVCKVLPEFSHCQWSVGRQGGNGSAHYVTIFNPDFD